MKKCFSIILALIMAFALLTGCGVAQSDYDAVVAERAELQTQYSQSKSDYDSLKAEHDKLVIDTADWLQFSAEEKATIAAQAESARIEAEQVAKKAAEEKAAEEKIAAEKAAAEAEKIAKEQVSLQDILIEPQKYDGKFVRITSNLQVMGNDLERKSFNTWLSTGSEFTDNDMTFQLEVFYEDMSDYKTWATLSSANYPIITIAGTIHIFRNTNNSVYINATEITNHGNKK
jgi:nucleoid-associated protein YgaU